MLQNLRCGHNPHELIGWLVIKYHNDVTNKSSWACADKDCDFWWQENAQLDQVLKQATTFRHLQVNDVDRWKAALGESGQDSLGAQIDEGLELEPLLKKQKQAKLDLGTIPQTGQKNKEEQLLLYQNKVDHVIMQLICVQELVPNIVDSDKWKELMNFLNGAYRPTSADTFATKHIPHEAVYVCQKQTEILCIINNLTLTFDGNTTQKLQSIYMAHATTPSCETYFLDAHQGSDEQHTTQWVTSKLMKVCNSQCISIY